ncbi:Adenosine 3'-phospho 5'-phosphosulfate transporter 2 [Histomonas meleagridis]|uniref:Adenosine 3'-phospho 5'-phosphosulfate transporter 2 n=1 Tax=Histomonas meleagridis TaxID=135588 RepID=UPI003559D3BD|nr:Adenosine 3'-phospho 5'-phosphosulfate transporter 2 [Histomonas meleagridis]KAH0798628.1 Adenosine 3'-phospho 5'-phosphosulfate transporter 2 [Histomonas meleagridis]
MEEEVFFFGINISSWPKLFILLFGAVGIFATFLFHGFAHEKLCSPDYYGFSEPLFLTFCQLFGYASLSFPTLFKIIFGKMKLSTSFKHYVFTSLSLIASMLLANVAALRLSYPTEVLFKSSKLIPVMIGNIIFLKKKPKNTEVISVVFIVSGLIGISLADVRGQNRYDNLGIVAVLTSLAFDAIASNLEDKMMSFYNASQSELISIIYSLGALIIGTFAIITGQMFSGIRRCIERPSAILQLLLFSMLGAVGIQFVYLIMKVFGSLTTVMITSLRKALTVCLSFLLFKNKQFTRWHLFSVLLLAAGMQCNIINKVTKGKKVEDPPEIHDEFKNSPLMPVEFEEVGK